MDRSFTVWRIILWWQVEHIVLYISGRNSWIPMPCLARTQNNWKQHPLNILKFIITGFHLENANADANIFPLQQLPMSNIWFEFLKAKSDLYNSEYGTITCWVREIGKRCWSISSQVVVLGYRLQAAVAYIVPFQFSWSKWICHPSWCWLSFVLSIYFFLFAFCTVGRSRRLIFSRNVSKQISFHFGCLFDFWTTKTT